MTDRIKPTDILSLLHHQGFRCAYSGLPLTPESVGADHRVPVARGGDHSLANIAMVTREVNSAKGTMTVDEFASMCRAVAEHMGAKSESLATASSPEDLSGCSDPIEILTRLGYVAAAEKVRSDSVRLAALEKSSRKQGGRSLNSEEYTEDRRRVIAELERQVASLRVARSQLRAQVGWKESEAAA